MAIVHCLDSGIDTPWRLHRAEALQIRLGELIELLGGTDDGAACNGGADDGVACTGGARFAVQRVARGATLLLQGAHAQSLYIVHSGSFKSVKTAEDGYEHVLAFAWRREVIGYDGLYRERYAFSAVALEDSRVVALPMAAVAELRQRSPAFDVALQRLIARQLAHAGEIAEVMSAVAAEARLARFLVQLSARMAECGQSPRCLRLRMNRRDIANHLGLAHETISRSLRLLADRGWLQVDNRELEILDAAGLRRCARSTRGAIDDAEQTLACAA